MDCSNCSVDGVELVKMESNYENGAMVAKCPRCGDEEILGFGRL